MNLPSYDYYPKWDLLVTANKAKVIYTYNAGQNSKTNKVDNAQCPLSTIDILYQKTISPT